MPRKHLVDIDHQLFDCTVGRRARRLVDIGRLEPLPDPNLEKRLRLFDLAGMVPVENLAVLASRRPPVWSALMATPCARGPDTG